MLEIIHEGDFCEGCFFVGIDILLRNIEAADEVAAYLVITPSCASLLRKHVGKDFEQKILSETGLQSVVRAMPALDYDVVTTSGRYGSTFEAW